MARFSPLNSGARPVTKQVGFTRAAQPDEPMDGGGGGGDEEEQPNPFGIPAIPAIPPVQFFKNGGNPYMGEEFVAGDGGTRRNPRPEMFRGEDGKTQILGQKGPQLYKAKESGTVYPSVPPLHRMLAAMNPLMHRAR